MIFSYAFLSIGIPSFLNAVSSILYIPSITSLVLGSLPGLGASSFPFCIIVMVNLLGFYLGPSGTCFYTVIGCFI
jgi:hypothetical protein